MPAVARAMLPVFELKLDTVAVPVDQDQCMYAALLDKDYASETRIPSAVANYHIL